MTHNNHRQAAAVFSGPDAPFAVRPFRDATFAAQAVMMINRSINNDCIIWSARSATPPSLRRP